MSQVCKTSTCESTELVFSGVDAFIIGGGGFPTETYCYDCANTIASAMRFAATTTELDAKKS